MNRTKIAAVALVATVVPLGVVGTAIAANAASEGPQARISAQVSDTTPASGSAFHVSGTFTEGGKPAGEETVKVQAQQADGSWKTLKGAHELTTSKGTYNLDVVLDATGHRDLRVVGVGLSTLPNAYQPFTVTVH